MPEFQLAHTGLVEQPPRLQTSQLIVVIALRGINENRRTNYWTTLSLEITLCLTMEMAMPMYITFTPPRSNSLELGGSTIRETTIYCELSMGTHVEHRYPGLIFEVLIFTNAEL